ncbi:MAG: glycosyltransferase family 9 protein [Marinifilaceae bacterium]
MPKKFLIIRLSSIGDIIQCMPVVDVIKNKYPDAEIHWFARKDMSSFLAMDKRICKIWGFDRKDGLKGIISAAKELKKEEFDFIYDAHSNIRSNIIKFYLLPLLRRIRGVKPEYILRSKERFKRVLLFKFGINKFPKPFKGRESYLNPLKKWSLNDTTCHYNDWQFPSEYKKKFTSLLDDKKLITIVPSANWEMKRWPVNYWKELIRILPEYKFIILAGPDDSFCSKIAEAAPDRVNNLAGQTSLLESCYIVSKSKMLISADTGFMHAADLFGTNAIAIIGPTAFGYPTGKTVKVLESNLNCRPCTKDGRGKCKQNIWQKCMIDITPKIVASHIAT